VYRLSCRLLRVAESLTSPYFFREYDSGLECRTEHACLMAPTTVGGDFCSREGVPLPRRWRKPPSVWCRRALVASGCGGSLPLWRRSIPEYRFAGRRSFADRGNWSARCQHGVREREGMTKL